MGEGINFDIQPLRGVFIEKYHEPFSAENGEFIWRDNNEKLHSFNGFPCIIRIKSLFECHLLWANHGVPLKTLIIDKKTEEKIRIDNIKKRKFTKRWKKL
jgi:hypothetical protein